MNEVCDIRQPESIAPVRSTDLLGSPVQVLSLGAGVQSSTMALMAEHGEITPKPSFCVFADTGDEPKAVYDWLDQLEKLLSFPVIRAQRSRLSEHLFEWGHSQIPAFTAGPNGEPRLGKRQCTKHWKIVPVQQAIRKHLSLQRKRLAKGHAIVWQGISLDEIVRMKDSREPWIEHRFPLIDLRMSRHDCIRWLKSHNYPQPPKSACVFCPYQHPKHWKAMREAGGEEWKTIVIVDRLLAADGAYLTKDLRRIDAIEFTDADKDQNQLSFMDECDGMCGV